jgi:hypothetical protein
MFENQYRSYVTANPFMRKLARAGLDLTNYFGCFHPSQTNYIASLAGELCRVTNDIPPAVPLQQRTLVDLLEEKHVSWKAYMEGYPGSPWNNAWKSPPYPASQAPADQAPDNGTDLARYFRKHNAFASFHSIQKDPARWGKIVDDGQFWRDVQGGAETLPEYGWFTPDIWNDGHYLTNTHIDTAPRSELVPQMATWLEHVFFGDIKADKIAGGQCSGVAKLGLNLDIDLLLSDPAKAWSKSRVPPGMLILVTFDEADFNATGYDTNYDGPNQIYTVALGDMITPGSQCDLPLNHYSMMRTVEKNFSLGDLGKNDTAANWLRPLWKQEFTWGEVHWTGLASTNQLGLAGTNQFRLASLDGIPILVTVAGGWMQAARIVDGACVSGERQQFHPVPADSIGLASVGSGVLLTWADAAGALYYAQSADGAHWSEAAIVPGAQVGGAFTLSGYENTADGMVKAMACWQGENGFIQYAVFADGAWQAVGEVGQLTDGPMVLCQFGPSLFLVYKERNTRQMRMTSYNLAPFNAFDAQDFNGVADPGNNTSLHQWAPVDFVVGNFAKKFAALQNDYLAWGNLAMAAINGEMHLVHRDAYSDTPSAKTTVFGLTGIMTHSAPYSNGYGSLGQAGWTAEKTMPAVELDPQSGIAMTGSGDQLTLVWQAAGSGAMKWMQGGYGP